MSTGGCEKLDEVINAYGFAEGLASCERYGSGHINDTFLIVKNEEGEEARYILQRMNHEVFKDPVGLMGNVAGVTRFLRNKIIEHGGDPDRETLNLVPTADGDVFYRDSNGNYWRVYLFIAGATCYNLVENAVKYNFPDGTVFVSVCREEDQVLLEVGDTGIGIPEEDLPKVFNRFYRVDKARSRAAGGTGLGLSIVRDTVRRHGGWVTARPRSPEGSLFTVGFPVYVPAEGEGGATP